MSDDHDEGDEEGGPTAAFSLVRYENPQIVQLEVEKTFLTIINTISIIFIIWCENLIYFDTIICTEGVLRRPMTYAMN